MSIIELGIWYNLGTKWKIYYKIKDQTTMPMYGGGVCCPCMLSGRKPLDGLHWLISQQIEKEKKGGEPVILLDNEIANRS